MLAVVFVAMAIAFPVRDFARSRFKAQRLRPDLEGLRPSVDAARIRSDLRHEAATPLDLHRSEHSRPTIPVLTDPSISEPDTVVFFTPDPAPAPAEPPRAAAADRDAVEGDDPERKKARKFARLLVSEIKLYNAELVSQGVAARDVYARLKGPIDRSVLAFESRIPRAVRAEFDYIHDELVRQLADGDPSKLGPSQAAGYGLKASPSSEKHGQRV